MLLKPIYYFHNRCASVVKKGIILAGGSGTRLRPITDVVCKQLLPIYDKPMIYYPLSTLMLLGIQDILIISTPKDTPILETVLGDGKELGINLSYKVQAEPKGLAEAFIVGADFVGTDPVCLILGDNILHMSRIGAFLKDCSSLEKGAYIVGVPVLDPERFGVIEYDKDGNVLSLEEKPSKPKSEMAAIGLYFYDGTVVEKAISLQPSVRGELEITDLNNLYLRNGDLKAKFLSRGSTWLDAGIFDTIMDAGQYMQIVEQRLGLKIGCIEEVAFMMDYINLEQLKKLAEKYSKSPYGEYLQAITNKSIIMK